MEFIKLNGIAPWVVDIVVNYFGRYVCLTMTIDVLLMLLYKLDNTQIFVSSIFLPVFDYFSNICVDVCIIYTLTRCHSYSNIDVDGAHKIFYLNIQIL